MNWHIPKNLSFENALQLTETLLEAMVEKHLKDYEVEEMITTLVSSQNGARGFFVIYLTSHLSLSDHPSEEVINALKTSPDIVSELLVKNLAMSSAMAITHRRNNDEKKAQGSDQVFQRTSNLIQQMDLELIKQKLEQLKQTIVEDEGNYKRFLDKWGYDQEQKTIIKNNIEQLLSNKN
ncbi:unknown [Crocosphaera subtropica ATCC 51142]|uniref:Uncharacterized protein n=1 Tax=Crocosphaera subtropica (strain ATCC 51142 / BH68) TaxID=43989 RepID=B1WRF0_CROS5|nr:hypothetical protein [Crocosphaera subtropica]ACB51799.1 unknown [Crocosphaera subtropica ATCC 51142]